MLLVEVSVLHLAPRERMACSLSFASSFCFASCSAFLRSRAMPAKCLRSLGKLFRSMWKTPWLMQRQLVSSLVQIVALRFAAPKSAISPNTVPCAFNTATDWRSLPTRTSTSPRCSTYIRSPSSPSIMMSVPAGKISTSRYSQNCLTNVESLPTKKGNFSSHDTTSLPALSRADSISRDLALT